MVTLNEVIRELLDEDVRFQIRCLRSFQLIYWMVNGGEENSRFRQAAAIFVSAHLSWRSRQLRRQGKSCREAFSIAISEDMICRILDDYEDSDLFFRLLYVESTIFRIDYDGISQFSRIADFCKLFMQVKTEIPESASFNNVAELTGGRTKHTITRKKYGRQSGFIYAGLSVDENYINLFVKGRTRDLTRGLLQGLRDRIRDGRTTRFLQLAKGSIAILNPELTGTLESAWPDLQPVEPQLPLLTSHQISLLKRGPRRSASERNSTSRLEPSPDGGSQ